MRSVGTGEKGRHAPPLWQVKVSFTSLSTHFIWQNLRNNVLAWKLQMSSYTRCIRVWIEAKWSLFFFSFFACQFKKLHTAHFWVYIWSLLVTFRPRVKIGPAFNLFLKLTSSPCDSYFPVLLCKLSAAFTNINEGNIKSLYTKCLSIDHFSKYQL